MRNSESGCVSLSTKGVLPYQSPSSGVWLSLIHIFPELSENEARARIARRIAAELEDGALVNLGIGIPQLVPDYVPKNVRLILQTENGLSLIHI